MTREERVIEWNDRLSKIFKIPKRLNCFVTAGEVFTDFEDKYKEKHIDETS